MAIIKKGSNYKKLNKKDVKKVNSEKVSSKPKKLQKHISKSKQNKAQGNLESLILIGGAVLIAVTIIAVIISLGGQSKQTIRDESEQVYYSKDVPLTPSIISVDAKYHDCIELDFGNVKKKIGTFSFSWRPISKEGTFKIIVEDSSNNQLSGFYVVSESHLQDPLDLNPNILNDILVVNVDLKNNSCGDSYYLSIEASKNNQSKLSNRYPFNWSKPGKITEIEYDALNLSQYYLDLLVDGSGLVNTPGIYYEEIPVTVVAIPQEGYSFVEWQDTSSNTKVSDDPIYTFIMPSQDYSLIAKFEEVIGFNTLNLFANPPSLLGNLVGQGNYPQGSTVNINASLSEGYTFINWTLEDGTLISDDLSFDYLMPSQDVNLVANFSLIDILPEKIFEINFEEGSGDILTDSVSGVAGNIKGDLSSFWSGSAGTGIFDGNTFVMFENLDLNISSNNLSVLIDFEDQTEIGYQEISVNNSNSCFILKDGIAQCVGYNYYGQLGTGDKISSYFPKNVIGVNNALSISSSKDQYSQACAVVDTGEVKCWGSNSSGQLGNGTTTESLIPVTVTGINNATKVVTGSYSSCALLSDGTVKCWGLNSNGQLGDGTKTNSSVPVSVLNLDAVVDISSGNRTYCALIDNGEIKCWGSNSRSVLGTGINMYTLVDSSVPLNVSGINNAIQVSSISQHACALLETGQVKCWGLNMSGQLGNGGSSWEVSTPVFVSGINNAVYISSGGSHTCALLNDNSLNCWGSNDHGQLNTGTDQRIQKTPVNFIDISKDVKEIDLGVNITCLLYVDGDIECVGDNFYGVLGNGTSSLNLIPINSYNSNNISDVSLGYGSSCFSLSNGTVKCAGRNYRGQLGSGYNLFNFSLDSILVPGVNNSIKTALSYGTNDSHACAILDTGEIKCWGSNSIGQLGQGNTTSQSPPGYVTNINNAVDISLGDFFSCALLSNGEIKCWGRHGWHGTLGDGTSNASSTTPVNVLNINNAVDMFAGKLHACAALDTGEVKCWGFNDRGQLGNGTTTKSIFPVLVSGINNAIKVAAGNSHSCALLSTGEVKCWGSNYSGELGDGTTSLRYTPVTVNNITNAVDIFAGYTTSCAVLDTGEVNCWGAGSGGLIVSDKEPSQHNRYLEPTKISGLNNVTKVVIGSGNICFLLTTGEAKCSGNNRDGLFGIGTNRGYLFPSLLSLNNVLNILSKDPFNNSILVNNFSNQNVSTINASKKLLVTVSPSQYSIYDDGYLKSTANYSSLYAKNNFVIGGHGFYGNIKRVVIYNSSDINDFSEDI